MCDKVKCLRDSSSPLLVPSPIRWDYRSFMPGISLVMSVSIRWSRDQKIRNRKKESWQQSELEREEWKKERGRHRCEKHRIETGMKYPAPQSKSLLDMEVANYCEGLDPSYTTLGFENAEVLYGGGGKCVGLCVSVAVCKPTNPHEDTSTRSTNVF